MLLKNNLFVFFQSSERFLQNEMFTAQKQYCQKQLQQFNLYKTATLGEVDSGHLKRASPFMDVKMIDRKTLLGTLITGHVIGVAA